MTAVGKILVFMNLVFAFVVGAFAVMSYTARTHWADGYKKLERSYEVVKATNDTNKAEADRLTKERSEYNQKLLEQGVRAGVLDDKQEASKAAEKTMTLMAMQKSEINKLRGDLKLARDREEEANRKVVAYEATTKAGQADVQRRDLDNKTLRKVLKDETDRNTELVKATNEMRDRAVAAEIQSKSYRDINSRLEEQMQAMARDLTRLKANGGRAATGQAAGQNPPPENVEGYVSRVDGNYVKLTIGSDAGLARGHTLHVFGLTGANSGYRGQIRLETVTATEAVGQVVGKARMPIKVGDTAADSIMGKR